MYFDFITWLMAHFCEELPLLMNEIPIKTKIKLDIGLGTLPVSNVM